MDRVWRLMSWSARFFFPSCRSSSSELYSKTQRAMGDLRLLRADADVEAELAEPVRYQVFHQRDPLSLVENPFDLVGLPVALGVLAGCRSWASAGSGTRRRHRECPRSRRPLPRPCCRARCHGARSGPTPRGSRPVPPGRTATAGSRCTPARPCPKRTRKAARRTPVWIVCSAATQRFSVRFPTWMAFLQGPMARRPFPGRGRQRFSRKL